MVQVKVKVKVQFNLEEAMKSQRGSGCMALLFFILGASQGQVVNAMPHPGNCTPEKNGTSYIGGRVGPKTGLDVCVKSRPNRIPIPGPSSPQQVVTPATLSRPKKVNGNYERKWTLNRSIYKDRFLQVSMKEESSFSGMRRRVTCQIPYFPAHKKHRDFFVRNFRKK